MCLAHEFSCIIILYIVWPTDECLLYNSTTWQLHCSHTHTPVFILPNLVNQIISEWTISESPRNLYFKKEANCLLFFRQISKLWHGMTQHKLWQGMTQHKWWTGMTQHKLWHGMTQHKWLCTSYCYAWFDKHCMKTSEPFNYWAYNPCTGIQPKIITIWHFDGEDLFCM